MRRPALVACALLLASGCVARNLARTLGEGRGEVRATTGGPFLGVTGEPLLIPSVRAGGRYGVTDWLDVDGMLALDPLVFGVLAYELGVVGQIVRVPDGFALSASAHGHLLMDLDDDLTTRGFPELGVHAEGPLAPWLTLYGGVFGIGSIDPPVDRPAVFLAPYLGVEIVFDRNPPVRESMILQVAWASPWEDLRGLTSWEPAGFGAIFFVAGWRLIAGPGQEPAFP